MVKLLDSSFIHKGGYFIGPRKTEVPTYLQSYASALVADINDLFLVHLVLRLDMDPAEIGVVIHFVANAGRRSVSCKEFSFSRKSKDLLFN